MVKLLPGSIFNAGLIAAVDFTCKIRVPPPVCVRDNVTDAFPVTDRELMRYINGVVAGRISISIVAETLKITSSAGPGIVPDDQLELLFQLLADEPIQLMMAARPGETAKYKLSR